MAKQARYQVTTLETADISAEAGVIRNVSVMTEGEASGHGVRVDTGTLQRLYNLAQGAGVKAFLNHHAMPSPADAIGIFSGFHMDLTEGQPGKLRATFTALKAFKEYSKREYATLFELAASAPSSFGVSVSIWQDEEEAADGGMPYIRPIAFDSADFVSTPAANKSLFTAKETVDVTENKLQETVIETAIQTQDPIPTVKKLHAQFFAKPSALARAVQLMAEGSTEDAAIEKVGVEEKLAEDAAVKAEVEALRAENAILKTKIAELQPIADAAPEVEVEMTKTKESLAAESAKVATLSAELADAQKQLRRYGTRPLNLGAVSTVKQAKTMPLAQFQKLSFQEQNAFMKEGGKLTD